MLREDPELHRIGIANLCRQSLAVRDYRAKRLFNEHVFACL